MSTPTPAAYHPDPTAAITELARIFAQAIHRLQSRRRLVPTNSLNLVEPDGEGLEFVAGTRLSVPTG